MRAEKKKKEWEKDRPLGKKDGGSMEAWDDWGPAERAATMKKQPGGSKKGLMCLTELTNDLSTQLVGISAETVEKAVRRLWTSKHDATTGQSPHACLGMDGDKVTDPFWLSNKISIPSSWPEKAGITVSITDPTSFPAKFHILHGDVQALSFWRTVGYIQHVVDVAVNAVKQLRGKSLSETEQEEFKKAQERECEARKLMEDAHFLQRNVTTTFVYCPTAEFRRAECLSLREDVEFMREIVGLTGWDRVVIAGSTRDTLRAALTGRDKRNIRPQEVADELAKVRWSVGREMSAEVVEKLIVLYDKFEPMLGVKAVIVQGQDKLGRASPFEEYSKLSIISGRCSNVDDTLWVMNSMLHEQVNRKVDSFSKAVLQSKSGPISTYLLRRMVLLGMTNEFLLPAVTVCQEALLSKPNLAETLKQMKDLHSKIADVSRFHQAKIKDVQPGPSDTEFLPAWALVQFTRLARQVMDGLKDRVLKGLLLKPPTGGYAAIKYSEHLRKLDGFQAPLDAIEASYKVWVSKVQSFGEQTEVPDTAKAGGQTPAASAGKPDDNTADSSAQGLVSLQQEISSAAKDLRNAWAPIVHIGDSIAACERAIEASSVYKDYGVGGAKRICYMYCVPTSWDHPKTRNRGVPLLPEDFNRFADVTSKLITPESESYAAVLIGKTSRQGAGIAMELGLSTQMNIVNAMKEKSKGSFRAKAIRMIKKRSGPVSRRGVAGILSDCLLLFYKGSWPSKMTPKDRVCFGGSTWDDLWQDVPDCGPMPQCMVPAPLKAIVFDDIWSSRVDAEVASESGSDADKHEDDGGGQTPHQEKGDNPSKPDGSQPADKKAKKDDKKKGKKGGSKKPKKAKKDDKKGKQQDDKKGKQQDKTKPVKKEKKKKGKEESKKNADSAKLKEARVLISAPACQGDIKSDPKTDVLLYRNEYDASVYSAVWNEWGARRGVIFTPGNGIAALEAVQREFPLLNLAMNPEHAELLQFFVDCALAMAIQMQCPGNRLHDKELAKKIATIVNNGDAESDDEIVLPKSKKSKTDHKKKNQKNKDKSESASSDDSESGSSSQESDSDE